MANYKSLDSRWSDNNAFNSFYWCIAASYEFLDDDLIRVWTSVSKEPVSKSRVASYKRPENNSNFQCLTEKQFSLFLCGVVKYLGLRHINSSIDHLINILYLEIFQVSDIGIEEKLLSIRMNKRGF
jgi:hypothetical protein